MTTITQLLNLGHIGNVLTVLVTGLIYHFFVVEKTMKKQNIDETRKEAIRSVLRALTIVLGALMTFAPNIPFLEPINNLIKYLFGGLDSIVSLINEAIGVILTLVGFFYDDSRFEARSGPVTRR